MNFLQLFILKTVIFFLLSLNLGYSQSYIVENFENEIPPEWNDYIEQTYNWDTLSGGHEGHPNSPHQGNTNAIFYTNTSERTSTILVLDTIDLSSAIRPELSFSHAQEAKNGANDSLWVKYKTSTSESWKLLDTVFSPTDPDKWNRVSLYLPDQAINDTFILGFQATGNHAYGVCLDSVALIENGYYYQTFEDISIPSKWNEYVEYEYDWDTLDGGHSTDPGIPNSGNPESAYQGNRNAIFFASETGTPRTIMMLPSINLEYATKPDLVFAHAMEQWGDYWDNLEVKFKAGKDSSWVLLEEYTNPTEDNEWKIRNIELPERALQDTCIIGFDGISNGGHGVCIDSVLVVERGKVPKELESLSVHQASNDLVVSESSQNPVLRIDLSIVGNTGTLYFDSLIVNSLNTNDENIMENGVKLFLTNEEFFAPTKQLGTATSFENGKAKFTGINYDFSKGEKYLWITYDIAADSTHEIHNNIADAMINSGSIHIGGKSYPESDQSPSGERLIKESLYYDDFETDKGWNLIGEFQIDEPQGIGGWVGNSDPYKAYQGDSVLGSDLTGLNSYSGDYEPDLTDREYQAITKTIDADYYRELYLLFYRYLNVQNYDSAMVDISLDNGNTWQNVWRNSSFVRDNSWQQIQLPLPDSAEYKPEVKIRFTIGPTDPDKQYSGWNIDNLSVYGKFISQDVYVNEVIEPTDGCGHTGNDTVTIRVTNQGALPTNDTIPVAFSVDGGTTVIRDTIFGSIPSEGDTIFTFRPTVDLSEPMLYTDVFASTEYSEDDWNKNDTLYTEIYAPPTYKLPYSYGFENNENDFWEASESSINNSWEWGTPGGSTIQPEEPQDDHSWLTNLDGNYNNDENSYVMGPCYDMREKDYPVINLRIFSDSESGFDGANVQYSLDEEEIWHTVDTLNYEGNFNWDWYNNLDTIESLNAPGWDERTSGWYTAKTFLPVEITNKNNVRFRIHFASNNTQKYEGFAFSHINIFNAPDDVGIDTILIPESQCEPSASVYPVVSIKNFGLDSIDVGDSIPVGIDMQYETEPTVSVFDTCVVNEQIPPDSTYEFTLDKTLDIDTAGNYSLTAYTIMEENSEFYQSTNDTATKQVTIYGYPTADLGPDIKTVEPDTLTLSTPYDSDYSYSWEGGSGTPSGNEYSDLSISDKDTVIVTVENTVSGCVSEDSVSILRLKPDIGVDSILSPVDDCEIGEETYVKARVQNYGTDTLFVNDYVILGAIADGNSTRDTFQMNDTVNPGETFEHEFTKPLDMSTLDMTYNLEVYTQLVPEDYETNVSNDTLTKEVTSYGFPDFTMDTDTTVEALSYEIEAETGYPLYEWEYGEENSSTFTVTDSLYQTTGDQWYAVTVTDTNGCSTTDSAHVKLWIHDMIVSQKLAPLSDCELPEDAQAEIEVRNNGTDTVFAGEDLYLGFDLDNTFIEKDTVTLSKDLLPGDTLSHQFDSTMDMSDFGDYTFDFYTMQPNDMRPGNDTLRDITTAYGYPEIQFTSSDTVVYALSYTLDPGEFDSYYWHPDSSADRYFTVEESTETENDYYPVTVTDTNGCSSTDSAKVILALTDLKPVALLKPEPTCHMPNAVEVKMSFTNLSDYTFESDTEIPLGYIVEDKEANETMTLEEDLTPEGTAEYTFNKKVNISGEGMHTFRYFVNYSGDLIPSNDTLTHDVEIYGDADVDIGPDTLELEEDDFPYYLSAEEDYLTSYEWQNGSQNSSYQVTDYGTYYVFVTDNKGCEGSDTVDVVSVSTGINFENINADNYRIFIYPNPVREKLTVNIEADTPKKFRLMLFNNQGKTIYSDQITTRKEKYYIETQQFPEGVYYLRIHTNEHVHTRKIVVQ